jgi:hypothetical protein
MQRFPVVCFDEKRIMSSQRSMFADEIEKEEITQLPVNRSFRF